MWWIPLAIGGTVAALLIFWLLFAYVGVALVALVRRVSNRESPEL